MRLRSSTTKSPSARLAIHEWVGRWCDGHDVLDMQTELRAIAFEGSACAHPTAVDAGHAAIESECDRCGIRAATGNRVAHQCRVAMLCNRDTGEVDTLAGKAIGKRRFRPP